jgi:hypothetical protein
MAFDNVFEGSPPSGVPSGPALGVDVVSGTLYVSLPKSGKWVQASSALISNQTFAGEAGTLILDSSATPQNLLFITGTRGTTNPPEYVSIYAGNNIVNRTSTNFSIVVDTTDAGFLDMYLNAGNNVNICSGGAGNICLTVGSRVASGDGGANNGTLTNGNLYVGSSVVGGVPTVASLVLTATLSPTSVGTAGKTGQIAWDANKIYVCTAGGTTGNAVWKGVAISAV